MRNPAEKAYLRDLLSVKKEIPYQESLKRHYKHEAGIDPIQTDVTNVATASTLFVTLSGDT